MAARKSPQLQGSSYTDLTEGTGASPQKGQTVTVHYTGTLANGKKFDSSYDMADRLTSGLRRKLIKGWTKD